MTKTILFQDSFLVSGIMCFEGCGGSIQGYLNDCLSECIKEGSLPENAQLIMDAEPQAFGIHRIFITIESETQDFQAEHLYLSDKFKKNIESIFDVIDDDPKTHQANDGNHTNLINIAVNLAAIVATVALSVLMAPSLLLTAGLTTLTFLTTTYTARDYIINFFRNLRAKNIANMTTTVTAGWFLSLAHTLYHSMVMPLASSFSMVFMSFLMPVMLITIINSMDEIKRLVLNKTKKMHLHSVKTLFPQMAEQYSCYQFSVITEPRPSGSVIPANALPEYCDSFMINKNALKKGMSIHIPTGACFPVDCILIDEQTLVDSSLLTGEPQQNKHRLDFIPAGAINLGEPVRVYAKEDPYNSTVNKLLFRSNRKLEGSSSTSNNTFTKIYIALNVIGLTASIMLPYALGLLSIPLLLQNTTGILFAICPCTLAIAHQLPRILSIYQRSKRGIIIRDETLCDKIDEIHTIIFDKTGTLTTGNSEVESCEGISRGLLERVYLLEKHAGGAHPLARAVKKYYESRHPPSLITNVETPFVDFKSRGLSAVVQGKLLHIGNLDYLHNANIKVPVINSNKLAQGFSAIYIAEDRVYQGVIYIKHEMRKDMLAALAHLKRNGKKIIMLTGDSKPAAIGFNQQNGAIFDLEHIHAEQTPQNKEAFIETIMKDKPKGVWFVGDGLNDAACARMVSEKGGVSCAITSDEKASFFTDISLNGSLDYLFEHNKLNEFLKKNTQQNQFILIYGTLSLITFIITFSILSLAVSPIIPLMIMVSTTLIVLFNSYRMQLEVENALDKNKSWLKQLLASDWSLGLLLSSSLLLSCGLLLSIIATDIMLTISSACILTASASFSLFVLLATAYVFAAETTEPRPSGSGALASIPLPDGRGSDVPSQSITNKDSKSSGLTFFGQLARKDIPESNGTTLSPEF